MGRTTLGPKVWFRPVSKVSLKQRVYKNVTVRWKNEMTGGLESALILSPYITAPTSETVTRDSNSSTCEIYTLFSAETFASGSSSLQAVKKLFQRGFTLYHMPELHAKVVLTSEGFASVGSQNLTGRGTRSLEASSVLHDKEQVLELRKLVESWLPARELITLEMILDMEALLKPVLKLFTTAQKAATEVDLLIAEKEKVRREEQQQLAEKLRREAEEFISRQEAARLLKLQKTISESTQAQYPLYCRLKTVETGSWENPSFTSSLMVSSKDDNLCNWTIDRRIYKLDGYKRYICLIEESGKFGWARVTKTRLTFFHRSVSKPDVLFLGATKCRVQFHAKWSEANERSTYNLIIEVSPLSSYGNVQVSAWLSLNAIEILDVSIKTASDVSSSLETWIHENEEEFKRKILTLSLSPFKYEKKLAGVEANTFLRGHSYVYYYKVKLHLIGGSELLVIHK